MKVKRYLLPIIGIIFLIVGLWVAYLLSQQKTNLREKAAVNGGVGTIALSPQVITKYTGDTFSSVIKFNTKGFAISTISLRLTYNYSGATPELEIVDSSGNVSNQVFPDPTLLSTGDWSFPVKSVTRANGKVTIDIAAINTNVTGYTNNTDTNLATIYFKASRPAATNPVSITYDWTNSQMMTKSGPVSSPSSGPFDILGNGTNPALYTITTDTTAPAAITNLSASNTTTTSTTLSWTAPTDSGPLGKASGYDIRYSTSPITAANFNAASTPPLLTNTIPGNPGTPETASTNGLSPASTYYFAIKSSDAANNFSTISNVVSVTTVNPCTQNNPTLSLSPSSQTGMSGQPHTYAVSVKNNDTAGCSSSTYTLSTTAPSTSWTLQLTQASLTVVPGQTSTVNLTVTPADTVTNGSYNFTIPVSKGAQAFTPINGTYVITNPLMSMKFKLQGLTKNGATTNANVTIKNTSGTIIGTFSTLATSDAAGVFTATKDIHTIITTNGTYDIFIKDSSHLQKKITMALSNSATNNVDWTTTPLMAGDFDNNNVINITDIAAVLSIYTQLSTPVTPSNQIYDVNGDALITINDIAIPLVNYTALTVPGD